MCNMTDEQGETKEQGIKTKNQTVKEQQLCSCEHDKYSNYVKQ